MIPLLLRWCGCTPRLSSSDEPSHRKHGTTTKASDSHQPHVVTSNVAHAIGKAYNRTPRVLVRATNLASAQTQIWGTLISISSPPQASSSQDSGKASAHDNPKSSECSKSPRTPSAQTGSPKSLRNFIRDCHLSGREKTMNYTDKLSNPLISKFSKKKGRVPWSHCPLTWFYFYFLNGVCSKVLRTSSGPTPYPYHLQRSWEDKTKRCITDMLGAPPHTISDKFI